MLGPGLRAATAPLSPVSSRGHADGELRGRVALGVTLPTCWHFRPPPRRSLHSRRHKLEA